MWNSFIDRFSEIWRNDTMGRKYITCNVRSARSEPQ